MNKSRNEIPTIDVNLVTITTKSGKEFGFDTAKQIEVEVQSETDEAVKLVVKGILRAQKPKQSTITGHKITLHDNVLNPELVKVLQGGKLLYFTDNTKTVTTDTETKFGFAKYEPPLAGSPEKGEIFKLNAYSAIYNAAGIITGYEKTTYPNCMGEPVAFKSEDGAFRAPEYTINSAPSTGEAPYTIEWVKELPILNDPDLIMVNIVGTNQTATLASSTFDLSTMFTVTPSTSTGTKTYAIASGDNVGTISGNTLTMTATGTANISLTIAATSTHSAATATATLTVS